MKQNYDASFALVLRSEGGYVDNPRDPGGATNLGVTQATLARHRGRPVTKAEVRALTKAEAGEIYRKNFWAIASCDELPAGVDYAVFDVAVNSGPGRAAKLLQRVVGTVEDGVIGSRTRAAVAKLDPATVVRQLCAARLRFLQQLPTWATFGKGWSSRVASVQRTALSMAAANGKNPPQNIPANIPPPAVPAPLPSLPAPSPTPAPKEGSTMKAILTPKRLVAAGIAVAAAVATAFGKDQLAAVLSSPEVLGALLSLAG